MGLFVVSLSIMGEQLPGLAKRRRRAPAPICPAAVDPIAKVVLDTPLAHVDEPFDYLVPNTLDANAQVGVRVRAPFGRKILDGFVVARCEGSEHTLVPLKSVTSPLAVLTGPILRLCRLVARRYAGSLADVLRLAVPPRHVRAETIALNNPVPAFSLPNEVDASMWRNYRHGDSFLSRLALGQAPWAAWTALPSRLGPWPGIVAAAHTTIQAGKRVLIVAPTSRDLDYLATALEQAGYGNSYARLEARDGPARRYETFIRILRGELPIVIGTRSAAFAPVPELGLVVVWDDGNDIYKEQHLPHPYAAVVAAMHAQLSQAALLLASHSRSTTTEQLVANGHLVSLTAPRDVVRRTVPHVRPLATADMGADGAAALSHLPPMVVSAIRKACTQGPVLIQVPRAGGLHQVRCESCWETARCQECNGPLSVATALTCRWCGRIETQYRCRECGHNRYRTGVVGSTATAEQIGRTIRNVRIVSSSAESGIKTWVEDKPMIVVATVGSEPRAVCGFRLTVLLDARSHLLRPQFDADEEAMRKLFLASALTIPATNGGEVLLVGDMPARIANALVAWDPIMFARADLDERKQLSFPPAVRMAAVSGDETAVADVISQCEEFRVLGPTRVPAGEGELLSTSVRALIISELEYSDALTTRLSQVVAARRARGLRAPLRIQIDPRDVA